MRCKKCNAELMHNDYEKCPYCGEIIHNHEMFKHKEIIKCKNCNATITDEYEVCPYCNKLINEKNFFIDKLNFLKNENITNENKKNLKIIKYIFWFIVLTQILPIIMTIIAMFIDSFNQ